MGSSVSLVLGTRPEIIKLAPVVRELESRDISFTLVHTGQHYSENLDDVFFDQLSLSRPDHDLEVGSGTHATQTAAMMQGVEAVLDAESPETVLVQGDTNSTLAGGLVAGKRDVSLGHVEAGLRSFDRQMPEEVNRRLVDHVADHLFAPTETAASQLRTEGIEEERIFVTGNTVVDALREHEALAAAESDVLERLDVRPEQYAVLTAHRAENVDDRERFAGILDGVGRFSASADLPVVYPIHPRAENRLAEFDLTVPAEITFVDPLSYLDFLRLQSEAAVVFTDSGGVQEETCVLSVPCVTLRDNTERPETLEVGSNVLAGTEPDEIAAQGQQMAGREPTWENPFGDGHAAERIVDRLEEAK